MQQNGDSHYCTGMQLNNTRLTKRELNSLDNINYNFEMGLVKQISSKCSIGTQPVSHNFILELNVLKKTSYWPLLSN